MLAKETAGKQSVPSRTLMGWHLPLSAALDQEEQLQSGATPQFNLRAIGVKTPRLCDPQGCTTSLAVAVSAYFFWPHQLNIDYISSRHAPLH